MPKDINALATAVVLRRSLVGGVFLLLVGIYVFVFIFNEIAPWKDDAIYLVSGKALAEGRGYRLIDDPETPPPHFPFFYPFVLSLVSHFPQVTPDISPPTRRSGVRRS